MKFTEISQPAPSPSPSPSRDGNDPAPRHTARQILESFQAADWWIYEILSLVISAGALIATIVLLSNLDNKPQPSWTTGGRYCAEVGLPGSGDTVCRALGISLNSVVAWLGTIARVGLLVPLSNSLGQLKWSWFSGEDRSLADFEAFDLASRGVNGSIKLIWRLRARYLATISALGIILCFAFDPFVQNLVGYYTKSTLDPSQVAFISNSSIFSGDAGTYNNYPLIDPKFKASIMNALTSSDARQFWSQPHHVCSSGNCEWPPLVSIGLCTSCEDTTSQVKKNCSISKYDKEWVNCTLSLPPYDELQLSYEYTTNILPIGSHNLAGRFLGIFCDSQGKVSLWKPPTVASIYLDVDQNFQTKMRNFSKEGPLFLSSVCKIAPCVRSIRSSYKQADQVTETPYKEEVLKTWWVDPYNLTDRQPSQVKLPIAPEYGLNNQSFSGLGGVLAGINSFFGLALTGSYDWAPLHSQYNAEGTLYGTDAIEALWNANYTGHGCASENRISCGLELATKGIFKTVRDQPWIKNGTQGTSGEAYSAVIFVRVSWYWISLPIFVWLLALFTFLSTAWKSSTGIHVWRNSPLPLIFLKLREEEHENGGVSYKALTKRAERYQGRVQAQLNDIRFVGTAAGTGFESE